MRFLVDTEKDESWRHDNPTEAAREFLEEHFEFELARPRPRFHPDKAIDALTFFPDGWLRRR